MKIDRRTLAKGLAAGILAPAIGINLEPETKAMPSAVSRDTIRCDADRLDLEPDAVVIGKRLLFRREFVLQNQKLLHCHIVRIGGGIAIRVPEESDGQIDGCYVECDYGKGWV